MDEIGIVNDARTIEVHVKTEGLIAHAQNDNQIVLIYEDGKVWKIDFNSFRTAVNRYRDGIKAALDDKWENFTFWDAESIIIEQLG
jgi:hypothetical protein